MLKQHAAQILNLTSEITPSTTKEAWKAALKKYHPDINPAGAEMAQMINAAYEELKDFSGSVDTADLQEFGSAAISEALNAIITCPGLEIEVCGSWIWVGGETRTHKEALKSAKFRWAKKKEKWCFAPPGSKSRGRGKATMSEIRNKYGSSSVKNRAPLSLGGA